MKKILIAATAAVLLTACGSQKETAEAAMAKNEAKTVATVTMNEEEPLPMGTIENGNLMGVHNEAAFNKEPFSTWFQPRYEAYEPDVIMVDKISDGLQDVEIRAYMGTWCGDSKREVPKFYKLLDQTEFNQDNLTLIAVDRSKQKPVKLVDGFNVIRVPTFIFYRDGEEIGRFVERPRESLEADILKIVSGQDYKHSYEN